MDPNPLNELFSAAGPLARAFDGYCERREQIEMAQAVQAAIRDARTVVLEAGTGVGKTAAYLVPALIEGGKVIVSTGTKALQDQLFHRDLPAVRDALGVPVKVALLKGRSNYLCWHHLDRTNQDATLLGSKQEVRDLSLINRFAPLSVTGDKAECPTVPEHAAIWARVTSTRENCLGSDCPRFADCFVVKARREAQDADVVVVNHHLFFADLMLREEGVPELLPNAQTIVFDEAHQLPDTATLFFGESVSTAQVLDLVRDTLAIGQAQARDAAQWNELLAPVERAARDLRLCFGPQTQRTALPQLGEGHLLRPTVDQLQEALYTLREVLDHQSERGPDLANLLRRTEQLIQRLAAWGAPERAHEPELCWVDVGSHGVQLHRTPISVADVFRRQRLGLGAQTNAHTTVEDATHEAEMVQAFAATDDGDSADDGSDDLQALMAGGDGAAHAGHASATNNTDADEDTDIAPPPRRAWVFTSATLAVKNDFSHFTEALGLEDAECAAWSSPYDYPAQAMLYVPQGLPLPSDAGHTEAVVDAALPLIRANRGRTFVLCTSLRAVARAADRLKQIFQEAGDPFPVLQQGDAPRPTLLDDFRRAGNAVLVGSHSFWEGIDVKGDALTLVVIDKLPFAPPDDPVLAKRLELLGQSGGNPFMQHQVPQAIIALKQGAGRLIRSETDHGVLMICDTRLIDKPYGRRIWQSLPPMKRTRSQDEVVAFLATL
ncbi:ATP-dependent DNA helicase DinG [Aquabacterium commune]|uniref:ATP-dependent DNA helicase DinG n=1 Tax=Aquabacterium commune TaxID=70586 RepID=A0A4R6RDR3_9BURK|nr:ATP-dependent DNA helicase [Aquabacterium commune]TDP83826.1 ATP-dependent DNA helicase DinG [Aquabacterium commune]